MKNIDKAKQFLKGMRDASFVIAGFILLKLFFFTLISNLAILAYLMADKPEILFLISRLIKIMSVGIILLIIGFGLSLYILLIWTDRK